jgi:sulfopyruvate decarboxylase TPP-binding subunit
MPGHSQLIERVLGASSMRAVPLTTEEEGVALLAGAWAGGQRGVLLMQSSGLGNCINMLSLTQIFRFPFLTLVTMRGEWGEFNPWQVPMGSSTAGVFELSGIKVLRASSPDEVRFASLMQDIGSGPRFASVKIDPANLERVLSNRDGAFIVSPIRGALGYQPI